MAELLRLMFHDSYHRRSSHDTVLWLPTTDSYQNAKTTTLSCVTFVLFIKPYYIIFNYILIKVFFVCNDPSFCLLIQLYILCIAKDVFIRTGQCVRLL